MTPHHNTSLPFTKMHGNGNDFVIIDLRASPPPHLLASAELKRIADRRYGIGCDQILVLSPPHDKTADVFVDIFNADGLPASACGNGARCVAWYLAYDKGFTSPPHTYTLETSNRQIKATVLSSHHVHINMGKARWSWQDIPLATEADTLHLPLNVGPLTGGCAVNVGNPHVVFFVDNLEVIDLSRLGPEIENHPLFPQKVNVSLVTLVSPSYAHQKVWERGVGLTLSCGTAGCAALAAGQRLKLCAPKLKVEQPGGPLDLEWLFDDHVLLTGPVALSFQGEWFLND